MTDKTNQVKLRNSRDSYKYYKSINKKGVNLKTYLDITSAYNRFLIDKVLDGELVTLPSRLGTLSIMGKKQKIRFDEDGNLVGLAPDWVKTKKLWDSNEIAKNKKQLVYHTNEHTSSVRYKFFWSKNRVLITNKTLYALRITRENKRAVHKKILDGKEYINF